MRPRIRTGKQRKLSIRPQISRRTMPERLPPTHLLQRRMRTRSGPRSHCGTGSPTRSAQRHLRGVHRMQHSSDLPKLGNRPPQRDPPIEMRPEPDQRPRRPVPGGRRNRGHHRNRQISSQIQSPKLTPTPRTNLPRPSDKRIVTAIKINPRLPAAVVPPQRHRIPLNDLQEPGNDRILQARPRGVPSGVRPDLPTSTGTPMVEVQQRSRQQPLTLPRQRPNRSPLPDRTLIKGLTHPVRGTMRMIPAIPISILTLIVKLHHLRMHSRRSQITIAAQDNSLITLPHSTVPLHSLTKRTNPRSQSSGTLASTERTQQRTSAMRVTRHSHITRSSAAINKAIGALLINKLPNHPTDRIHQMPIAVIEILGVQSPIPTRSPQPRPRHHRLPSPPRNQSRIPTLRALRPPRNRMMPTGQGQRVQRVHSILTRLTHPRQPLGSLQNSKLSSDSARSGNRSLRQPHPSSPPRPQISLPQLGQPLRKTVPTRPGTRPEDRPNPQIRTSSPRQQPRPAITPPPPVDLPQPRIQIVITKHNSQRRQTITRLLHMQPRPGKRSLHRSPIHGPDLDQLHRRGSHSPSSRSPIQTGQLPIGQSRPGGQLPDLRLDESQEPSLSQPPEQSPDLIGTQLRRSITNNAGDSTTAVQQRGQHLNGPAPQSSHPPRRDEVRSLPGHNGSLKMPLETQKTSPQRGHQRVQTTERPSAGRTESLKQKTPCSGT